MSQKGWRELPIRGLIVEPGNSGDYQTGAWRSLRPIIGLDKCSHCMLCWIYCPDSSIMIKDSKIIGVDLNHCKGCGICSVECPLRAITMVEEAQARRESQ